ncbi:MAG: hypothetical protein ABEJ25_03810 [Candidatus Bipolaricaulia bacterium]
MNTTARNYAEVAVFRPIRSTFEYFVPDQLRENVTVGSICRLPFRGESVRGVVLGLREEPDYEGEQKKVSEVISDRSLPPPIIELARWLSYTTLTPLGQVFNRLVPGDLSVRPRTEDRVELKTTFAQVRDFIERRERQSPKQVELLEYLLGLDEPIEKNDLLQRANSSRSPLDALRKKEMVEISSVPEIEARKVTRDTKLDSQWKIDREYSDEQKLECGGYSQYAVNGTAGCRLNTYLKAVRDLVRKGTVLMLAPNVMRAEELTRLIGSELDVIALSYHSDLTGGEISSRWNLALAGEVDVFVGVLSAIYLPVPSLGGIVVEGDGERNYELTEQDPKGNLIETARKRAELEEVPVVIGGTGPSLQSYYRMKEGEMEDLDGNFPEGFQGSVSLSRGSSGDRALSSGLVGALRRNYEQGDSALIVGGRAGLSGAAVCEECGEVVRCSDCEVPLIFTGSGNYGICPYCGSKHNLLVCDSCGSDGLKFIGSGLEKAEAEVRSLLPKAEVRRFDYREETWEDFLSLSTGVLNGEIDVLLGTSILESLYFQNSFSLVGLLDLDLVTNRPTYRSTELLAQRILAGVDLVENSGKLFIQTRGELGGPWGYITAGDWVGLYESELESRSRLGYPPHRDLIKVEVERNNEEGARRVASELAEELSSAEGDHELLGPSGNRFEKRKGHYRYDLIVKTREVEDFFALVHSLVSRKDYGEVRLNPFG